MKLAFIKNKNELTTAVLLGLAAVFGFIILIKMGGFLVTSVTDNMLVKKAIAQNTLNPDDAQKCFAKFKAVAVQLEKNLFVMDRPNPGQSISGILGNEVLINSNWYKVGGNAEGAEILAIEPTQVKIRWNGQENYFSPMGVIKTPQPEKQIEKQIAVNTKDKEIKVKLPVPHEPLLVGDDPLAWMGANYWKSKRLLK
ncbi:MAG TPA: hypothetical protein PLP05_06535 [Sedimentisphaerales bacterium]|nr:hypothetical protein [Sedimentisphaerales bacterium]